MQFSLPNTAPSYPDPAIPGVVPAGQAAAGPGANPTEEPTSTFEQFMPKEAAEKDQPAAETADVGKMSAILGASFWMPVVPPPAAVPPSTGSNPSVAGPGEVAPGAEGPASSAPAAGAKLTPGRVAKFALNLSSPSMTFPAKVTDSFAPAAALVVTPGKIPSDRVPDGKGVDADFSVSAPEVVLPEEKTGRPELAQTSIEEIPAADPAGAISAEVKPTVVASVGTAAVEDATALGNTATAPSPKRPVAGPGRDGEKVVARAANSIAGTKAASPVDAPDAGAPSAASAVAATDPRPSNTAPGPVWEKTAAAHLYGAESGSNANSAQEKDFLKTSHVAVTAAVSGVGTGVAKVTAIMAAVLPNRSKSGSSAETALPGMTAVKLPALEFSVDSPAPVATLRETMSAVVSAVDALERSGKAGQNSVDLQFHVGSERLALRVELRDGIVHTTFHTDSSELRSALAREWQSVIQPSGARDTRLADPVFSSPSAGGNDASFSSAGQGTPHQRQPVMQDPLAAFRTAEFSDLDTPVSTVVSPVASSSNSLLNAFA